MTRTGFLALICSCVLLSCAAASQESSLENPFLPAGVADIGWPHIRGGNFDGQSAEINLADQWPDNGPPVLWVKELGQGYSSIVVKDNRAYTQYQSLGGQYVICMDAASGKTLWEHRYDWPFEATGLYPGPRSTPTIYRDKVYFATPAGSVGCLSLDGDLIWEHELKENYGGKGTGFGYACSPTLVEGKVIMPVGGKGASMVALDADNGKLIWKAGDSSASYTPAYPIRVDGQTQIIGHMEHDIVAFDLETGKQLWKQKLSRGYDEHSAWPIYHDSHLWTAAPFQAGSQLLRLSGGEEASMSNVWQSPLMSNDVSSSVLVDGFLYGFDLAEAQSKAHRPSRGSFRCMDFMTGETMWLNGDAKTRRTIDYEINAKNQTIGHANVIVADGKLILFNDLGDLILAKADPNEYVELARTPALPGEICWTTPALDRGRIFVRNHSRAVCLFIGKQDLLKKVAKTTPISVGEIPQGSVKDWSDILGVEPEYAMDPPTWKWLRNWYLASLAILVASGFAAALFSIRWPAPHSVRWCFWLSVVTLGLVSGTVASLATDDFVFTWPVIVFIAFQIAFNHASIRRAGKENVPRAERWQARIIAIGFLATCFGYFLVCRRLSLVTEWVFLCGFAGAAPVLLIGRIVDRFEGRQSLLLQFLVTIVGYTTFHFTAVIVLSMKYEIGDF